MLGLSDPRTKRVCGSSRIETPDPNCDGDGGDRKGFGVLSRGGNGKKIFSKIRNDFMIEASLRKGL